MPATQVSSSVRKRRKTGKIRTELVVSADRWIENEEKRMEAESIESSGPLVLSHKRLPPVLDVPYSRIRACTEMGMEKEALSIIASLGVLERQMLFCHETSLHRFNPSAGCRFLRMDHDQLQKWMDEDGIFQKMWAELHWHKGNFFEQALVGLVEAGEASAVIFANKTYNKDRGYKEKEGPDVNVNIQQNFVPVDSLDLPVETRREILTAIRADKEKPRLITNTVIPAKKEGTP